MKNDKRKEEKKRITKRMTREGKIIKIKLLKKCHGEGGKRENQGTMEGGK